MADLLGLENIGENLLYYSGQTTDATETTLGAFTVPDNETVMFIIMVSAQGPSNKNYWAKIEGGVRRTSGGSATLVGTRLRNSDAENSAAYVADIDVSGTTLRVRVTGTAAETVNWQAKLLYISNLSGEQLIAGDEALEFTLTTTDNTESVLGQLTIPDESVVTFRALISARYDTTGSNKSYWAVIEGAVRRNNAGNAALVGNRILTEDDEGTSGYSADIDVSTNFLRFKVTGATSESVNWRAKVIFVGDTSTVTANALTAFQWSSTEQVYPFELGPSGQILYCKEISLGTLPNNGVSNYDLGMGSSAANYIHKCDFYARSAVGPNFFGMGSYAGGSTQCTTQIYVQNFQIYTTVDFTAWSGYVRLIYWK